MPYENLTKIIKADKVLSPASAMRYPDELIGDYLRWGTGGTCFSLTAAVIAVLDSVGIEAYPVLADRYYGPDTHCGIVQPDGKGSFFLMDPGYLLFKPMPVPVDVPVLFTTGFNTVELRPVLNGNSVELYTIVRNNRKLRLTFKMQPASDEAFRRAWEGSFAFEMMHYPVLTRIVNGEHVYLQGDALSIRSALKTMRTKLTPAEEFSYISGTIGIHRDIVTKAMEKLDYGRS
jgi:hypothetical protein